MNLLGGGAAALFGEIFAGSFLPARLWANATTYAADGTMTRTETAADCLVQVDRATERMVQSEGYTATDRALYVLASSYDGPVDTDYEIGVDEGPYAGTRWKIAAPIDRDPAAAYWLVRGVMQTPDPDYENREPAQNVVWTEESW